MNIRSRLAAYAGSFSFVGLAVAMLMFAASVTPSLLPRHYIVQGLLSGFALAVGYGIGVALVGLYHYLEFRDPPARVQRIAVTDPPNWSDEETARLKTLFASEK